ncbi:MAG: phosphatase PAP2 family protein [Candidatus Eisenbacteria bacterium]|uniref:Phosphatase PAP2 family protein n=1 Tax=Eiseniibacteriota bacterium TaxID=2212470 RepID=A0A956M1V2_UNCEI|nr:phosphatase PAP2 family protein [Candidatus Eisenbacteria bacterium]
MAGESEATTDLGSSRVAPGYLPADLVAMVFAAFDLIIIGIGFRRVEHAPWLALGFAAYLAVLISLRWLPPPRWRLFRFLRDAHALFAIGPAYAVAGMINQVVPSGYFDDAVIGWDRALFGGHPNADLAARLPWAPLSEFLHLSYWLYLWLLPLLGFTLYLMRRYDRFRIVATTVSATFFLCQFVFVLFPVEGPYYTFPHVNAPGSIFPPLVYGTLERGAAIGTAFPSSHCATATVVAISAWRFAPRPLAVLITILTCGIVFGTVYGGFHYAIDALVGLALGLTMGKLGPVLHARLDAALRRAR